MSGACSTARLITSMALFWSLSATRRESVGCLVTFYNAACCSTGTRVVFYRECIIIHRICLLENKQVVMGRMLSSGLWLPAVSPFTRHEVVGGSRGMAPFILNIGARWTWVVDFIPWPLYSRGTNPGSHRIGV